MDCHIYPTELGLKTVWTCQFWKIGQYVHTLVTRSYGSLLKVKRGGGIFKNKSIKRNRY